MSTEKDLRRQGVTQQNAEHYVPRVLLRSLSAGPTREKAVSCVSLSDVSFPIRRATRSILCA